MQGHMSVHEEPLAPPLANTARVSAPSNCCRPWAVAVHPAVLRGVPAVSLVMVLLQVVGSSSDKQLLARTNSQSNLRPPVAAIQQPGSVGVTAAAPSPDGSLVAVACKDGVLRIYELATSALVAGFKVCEGLAQSGG